MPAPGSNSSVARIEKGEGMGPGGLETLHSYGLPVIGLLVGKAYEEAGGPIVRRDARGDPRVFCAAFGALKAVETDGRSIVIAFPSFLQARS